MYLNPLQIMKIKKKKPHEESFDSMMIPHWTHYLTPGDVSTLNAIATSKRLSGNLSKKIELIKTIMI